MEDARRFMRLNPRGRTAWKTLRTACANLRAVIDAGLLAYFEEYLAETETIRRQRPAGFLQAFEGHGGVGRSKGEKRAVHSGQGWHATKGQGAHS